MAAITVQGVGKQFGEQVVLENVSLELQPSEIVGLVGANGSGKTTLFRIMAGELAQDIGTVARARGLGVGYLKQEPDVALGRTLHDEVGSVFEDLLVLERRLHAVSERMAMVGEGPELPALMEDYERINGRFLAAGGHTYQTRLNEILGGLGFTPADYALPMAKLSGGQKCRAALAKLLLGEPDFLLLDEPTNHLDIDAVGWLERFLAGHHGGAVIVSHDRYLLDRLCTRIIELERNRITSFRGNYTRYHETRELHLLTRRRQSEKDAEFIKKERAFIAKHLAGQRTKEAQGRRKRLERRLAAGEFVTESARVKRTAHITFKKVDEQAGTVLRCDDLTMAFDDHVLFTDLTLLVRAGDRLGITGPNGTGKTTLLRIILGEIAPLAGEFILDPKLSVGYYGQENVALDPNRTIVQEIRAVRTDFSEQDARSFLARFLFFGDDAFKTLGMLSGGEQSRVRLAGLILQNPEILILDEPTNHLDIPSCEALEETLGSFTGTVLLVSHDRYFLDRVVDRLLVLRPDAHAVYPGNYSYYLEQVEQQRAEAKGKAAARLRQPPKQARRQGGKKSTPSPYDRLSIEELETLVVEREVELAALQGRFGDPKLYKDPDALAELYEEMDAVAAELAEVDAAWQERVEHQ